MVCIFSLGELHPMIPIKEKNSGSCGANLFLSIPTIPVWPHLFLVRVSAALFSLNAELKDAPMRVLQKDRGKVECKREVYLAAKIFEICTKFFIIPFPMNFLKITWVSILIRRSIYTQYTQMHAHTHTHTQAFSASVRGMDSGYSAIALFSSQSYWTIRNDRWKLINCLQLQNRKNWFQIIVTSNFGSFDIRLPSILWNLVKLNFAWHLNLELALPIIPLAED